MKIDKRKARSLLRQVVKGREDTRVLRCTYATLTEEVKPNCLIGHALNLADRDGFLFVARHENTRSIEYLVRDVGLPFKFTPGAIEVFKVAQQVQDHRGEYSRCPDRTWGNALEEALKV